MITLSIIIPVGDIQRDEENLLRVINDFANLEKCELIIVFDFKLPNKISAIGTLQKIMDLSKEGIIKVAFSHGKGPNNAREEGQSLAMGARILFCDSDDMPRLREISVLLEEGESKGYTDVFSYYELREDLTLIARPANIFSTIDFPGLWRVAIPIPIARVATYCGGDLAEDIVLLIDVLLKSTQIRFRNIYLYTHVHHSRKRLSNQATEERYYEAFESILGIISSENMKLQKNHFVAVALFYSLVISFFGVSSWQTRKEVLTKVCKLVFNNLSLLCMSLAIVPLVISRKILKRIHEI